MISFLVRVVSVSCFIKGLFIIELLLLLSCYSAASFLTTTISYGSTISAGPDQLAAVTRIAGKRANSQIVYGYQQAFRRNHAKHKIAQWRNTLS